MNKISPRRIEEAVSCIAAEIGDRLLQTSTPLFCESGLWSELACCVLSSQVPYDLAKAAAQRIDEAGVLCYTRPLDRGVLRSRLLALLSTPLPFNDGYRRYRFPSIRADQLASGFCTVYDEIGSLGELLSRYSEPRSARAWMVENIQGVGPKQASMFLRNIAVSYDLAIIDRHVLRYMHLIKLCSAPQSDVATIGKYERCELQLRQYASSVGCPLGLLDWAIWIVMRVASRIERQ